VPQRELDAKRIQQWGSWLAPEPPQSKPPETNFVVGCRKARAPPHQIHLNTTWLVRRESGKFQTLLILVTLGCIFHCISK